MIIPFVRLVKVLAMNTTQAMLQQATTANDAIVTHNEHNQHHPHLEATSICKTNLKCNKGGHSNNQPQSHKMALPTNMTEEVVSITRKLIL